MNLATLLPLCLIPVLQVHASSFLKKWSSKVGTSVVADKAAFGSARDTETVAGHSELPVSKSSTGQKGNNNGSTLADTFTTIQPVLNADKQNIARPKKNRAVLLIDATNTAEAVQLENTGTIRQDSPGGGLFPVTIVPTFGGFKELMDGEQYDEIVKLGKEMPKDELLRLLCGTMTILRHYHGLFQLLEDRKLIKGFLAHGDTVLVKRIVATAEAYRQVGILDPNHVQNAIILSFSQDMHDRAVILLEATQQRHAKDGNYDDFLRGLLIALVRRQKSASLKRFLILNGEGLNEKHAKMFAVFCKVLVRYLEPRRDDSNSQELLKDLIGQPSLLTPAAFAGGFLDNVGDGDPAGFLKYSWREAVEEGLKEKYKDGGMKLWVFIMSQFPNEFPSEYPPSDSVRTAVLERFPTKQQVEEPWIKENVLKLAHKFEEIVPDAFPTALWSIISEYAMEWTFLAPTLSQALSIQAMGDLFTEKLTYLLDNKLYEEIAELDDDMVKYEFTKRACRVAITVNQFNDLYGYLKRLKLVPSFLARGNMEVVRKVIVETELLETDGYGHCDDIYDAIDMSIKGDNHDRAVNLFKAAEGRPTWKNWFDKFMYGFFFRYLPWENSVPLKRFLTIQGEEFGKKHPITFGIVCQELVWKLRLNIDKPGSERMMVDLVGQPSLLTSTAFVIGFLCQVDVDRVNFIKYGWREAIEEGLEIECKYGGQELWTALKKKCPDQFSGEYPRTDEARKNALKGFRPTKQDREEAWAEVNAPTLSGHLKELLQNVLPKPTLRIISEYAITWVDLSPGLSPQKLTVETREQVTEQIKLLLRGNMYEVAELGVGIGRREFMDCVCPLMTTFEQFKRFAKYFDLHEVLPSFLLQGNMALIRHTIIEFKDSKDKYHIPQDLIHDAIILSLKQEAYDRAVALMETVQTRCAEVDEQHREAGITKFEAFMRDFFKKFAPVENSLSIKRFFTLHGEKLSIDHPNILEHFCLFLTYHLKFKLADPKAQEFLSDFVGQPSLLSPTAFARAFLWQDEDGHRRNFINYGWKEAMEEGLNSAYNYGSQALWDMMVRERPYRFFGGYPSTDEARKDALRNFPTKQDREEEWTRKNLPSLLARLEQFFPGLFPKALWNIIIEYATFTWLHI